MVNFISFGTENCDELLKKFYNNLLKYSPEPFILHYYSINYDSLVSGDNLFIHTIQIDKVYKRPVYYKPLVLLQSLIDNNSDNFIYLDLDIVLTKHFSSTLLFNKIKDSTTSMSPNHYWEYPFSFENNLTLTKGDKICELKSIKKCGVYVQNCLIVYSKKHFQFLLDWYQLVNDVSFYELSSCDEELYNVNLWVHNQSKNLGYLCVTNGTTKNNDIFSLFKEFQNNNFDKENFSNKNNFYKNYENKNVMIFHGIK